MLTYSRKIAAAAALLAGLSCLTACTSDRADDATRVVQLGGPGESNRELTEAEVEELEAPTHTKADVAFVQNMIPHHEQALVMTDLVEARTASGDLPKIAERITISQREEIAQLKRWLTERGEELPGSHQHHGGAHELLMPGMLTDAELAQLRGARGAVFDRLFLQYMIRHHEGAVIMVQDLLNRSAGGQEPEIFQLSQHIASDQQIEISRMKHLLVAR